MNETCPTCGRELPPDDNAPVAERLPMLYGNRTLYAIAGKPGLWHTKRVLDLLRSDEILAKTRSGVRTFYPATEAESRVRNAMKQIEVAEVANADD